MVRLLITISSFLFSISVFGQINTPKAATFGTPQPLSTDNYYTNSILIANNQTSNSPSVYSGNHANNIIANQKSTQQQMMGYNPPQVPPTDPAKRHEFIKKQYQEYANRNKQYRQHKEVLNILNEAHQNERNHRKSFDYYQSSEFKLKTKSYNNALEHLKHQLKNKNISLADAYFSIEKAYGNTYLDKEEYNKIIQESVEFIKTWITQNNLNLNNPEALHYGIQKFMSETLTVILPNPDNPNLTKKITHLPFFYDYEDFEGAKDFRNYFITKSLATGGGQCNSMPAIYLVLAEGLGAKAYLSFAPQHSFIKYPDNQGNIHGYEPTSNWKITDKWYQDNMFISPKAKANGIYLDTLNNRQIVANCMLDLAFGYMTKHGAADAVFINDCIQNAVQYFPKNNNIYGYFVYSSLLSRLLEKTLHQYGITDLKDITKSPEAVQLYKALLKNEAIIKQLGYQDMPEEMYLQLMKYHEFKGTQQQVSGKQKRNLFITTF